MTDIADLQKKLDARRKVLGIAPPVDFSRPDAIMKKLLRLDEEERPVRMQVEAEQAVRHNERTAVLEAQRIEREQIERNRQQEARIAHYEALYRQPQGFSARIHADLEMYRADLERHILAPKVNAIVDTGGMVALIGPVGTGKTTLAGHFAGRWWRERQCKAKYAKADDYLSTLRRRTQGFDAPESVEGWITQATDQDHLMILDEFDKIIALHEGGVQATQAAFWLEAIIDARYGRMNRPTIIVGNFTEETWASIVPPSIRDRFRVNGARFTIGGQSKRKPMPVIEAPY